MVQQFETSRFEYGLIIACSLVPPSMVFASGAPVIAGILLLVCTPPALFGLIGLSRPHRVSLTEHALTIRPVWGRPRTIDRRDIIDSEEIVSPPFATLIVRFHKANQRQGAITISHRFAAAGLGIRSKGQEAGINASSKAACLAEWIRATAP